MNAYLFLRLARRFLPHRVADFLMKHNFLMKRNIAEEKPSRIFDLYNNSMLKAGISPRGKDIAEIGCGKNIGVGLMLLQAGAASVTLYDPELRDIYYENDPLMEILKKEFDERFGTTEAESLLHVEKGRFVFPPTLILKKTLFDDQNVPPESIDLILSASTLEHISNISAIMHTCRKALKSQGGMLHFVDLRDHYFSRPYEMLKYSDYVWSNFLSPRGGSHLNRLKKYDYLTAIEKAGFNIISLENHFDIPENVFIEVKDRLHSKYSGYTDDDLKASGLTIIANIP